MARLINEYPITFPYGATSPPYSAAKPHRGNDLPLRYEPIVIGDTQIGISGETGWADGPHCHVQAGYDTWCQNTFNSAPYIGRAGTVIRTGTADQWGNYVTVQTSGVYVTYCHLSRIDVGAGRVINEQRRFTMDSQDGRDIYKYIFHRDPENDDVTNQWNGKKFSDIDFSTTGEWQAIDQKVRDYDNVSQAVRDRDATISVLNQQLAAAQQQVADERSRADTLASSNTLLTNKVTDLTPAPVTVTPIQTSEEAAQSPTKQPTTKTGLFVKLVASVLKWRTRKAK